MTKFQQRAKGWGGGEWGGGVGGTSGPVVGGTLVDRQYADLELRLIIDYLRNGVLPDDDKRMGMELVFLVNKMRL